MNDNSTPESRSTGEDEDGIKPLTGFARVFRSPLFNVILVGLISFTQPGIWNALNNTGAGGQQEPYLVNAANSLTFGIMVFGCSIFGIVSNKIGVKWTLVIGTLGYAPYSASLYTNNRYGVEWFVILGGATCGIAASALWASEGAIALGYAGVGDRGKFTGIWLGLRELGQLIGSAIQLSLNFRDGSRGKVGYTTYLVLIALQCLGLPLALLISPPEKVRRLDGSRLSNTIIKKPSFKQQAKSWWVLARKKQFLLLVPILAGFNWNSTYIGIYLARYFSVRSRTLASLLSGIAATVANIFWGWFLDNKWLGRPKTAKYVWSLFAVVMTALFAWQFVMEREYERTNPPVTLDWALPGFGRGFAVQVLFRFMNESHYMFVYWIVGTFFDDIETLTLAVSLIRSMESLGSCLAFAIGAVRVSPLINLSVAAAMFFFCIPFTSWAVTLVPEMPKDHVIIQDSDDEVTSRSSELNVSK
ncbi:major facilitator superfamily domain-containing protein [Stachybotrys elegans]|uniref:Major facilitator superfamily domain-containing protein n=1 Tax=Stachybotrys elegans TaxID=80388 RepID=A0A8K0WLY1_9HYPO|nr:major facilitator superfamily domain-containing protein [Stachybotrys elegans]